jgi:hypothetical protein
MTDKDLGTYQMLWDCSACGTAKLLGLEHRHCPGCGSAQDEDGRYFPSDEDKVAVADHKFTGADKECSACGSPMAAAANNCTNCGCGLDGAEQVDLVVEKEAPPPPAPKKKSGGSSGKFILFGIVAIVVFLVVMISWKKEVDVEATGKSWERTVQVEQYGPTKKSAWCDSLPTKARNVTRKQEVKTHREVPDGETCVTKKRDNGDGTFSEYQKCTPKTKKEPIYADKCHFTVDAWKNVRTARAFGGATDAAKWPDPKLKRTGKCVGCERESGKKETYSVSFKPPEGSPFDCPFPEAEWASIQVGSAWATKQSVVTGGSSCGALTKK